MRPTGAGLFPLLVLSFLAGLTFWLQRATEETAPATAAVRHQPDYFVSHFNYRHYDEAGDLRQTLFASRLEHFPDDDTALVSEPRLVYVSTGALVATADRGILDKEGKHIRLLDNVRVVNAPTGGAAETVITTSTLEAMPDDRLIRTDAPVRIAQGHSVVTAVGLESDGRSRVTVLGSRVHGVIEAHRR